MIRFIGRFEGQMLLGMLLGAAGQVARAMH